MAARLFLTAACLSAAGSVAYILLKLLLAAGGKHLSQNWRYHSVFAVSLLFVLPVYKLWALIPVPAPALPPIAPALPPILQAGGRLDSIPPAPGEPLPQTALSEGGVDWKLAVEWAAALWLLVGAGLLLWNTWRLLHYRRLLSQAGSGLKGPLQQIAQEAARLVGVTGEIRLLASPLVQTPMLIGFFRATILLPSEHLPDRDARLILAHELTHFRRGDQWKKLLVNVIQCIHWFNPIVYLLGRDFVRWLETSCDEEVVSPLSREQRKEYGYLLIDYAPTARYVGPKPYVSFASCRHKLERRISTMMKSNKKSHSLLGPVLAVVLVAGCLSATAFAAASDVEQTTDVNSDVSVFSVDDAAPAANDEKQTIARGAETVWEAAPSTADEQQSQVDDTVADMGIMPRASGELAAHSGYKYGSVTVGAGGTLTVSATYTPTNATMRIGYVDSSGVITYVNISNGSGSHTFEISKAGTYKIYIFNPSSYDVSYRTSYLVA